MRWVSCHESPTVTEAQLIVALLERHGIPCRVQASGALPFSTAGFGVQVVVPEHDLPRARAAIDDEHDLEWPAHTEASPSDVPAQVEEPRLRIMETVAAGLRLVVAHPFVFVAAIPGLVWAAIATAVGLTSFGFFATETCPTGSALLVGMPGAIVFGTLGEAVAIAIAAGAARGASSWPNELALVGRKLPIMVVLAALPMLLWPLRQWIPIIAVVLVPAIVYLGIRLAFALVAILVDDVGIREGLVRSWTVTNGAWWRTFGLNVVFAVMSAPVSWVPPPFRVVLACAFGAIVQTTLVLAYFRLSEIARSRPTPAPSADPAGSAPPRALPSPPPLRP
jgi:hypothetical protein